LRATFYIPLAACSIGRRAAEWQRAAETGHELGNHSIFHPAEGSQPWVREANNLDLYTLDRMQMELEVANNILKALDGRDDRTFAYPCSNPVLGNVGWPKRFLRTIGRANTRISSWLDRLHLDLGASRHNYSSLLQDLFVAARGGGPCPWPSFFDRFYVPTVGGDGLNESELWSQVERAIAEAFWGVFTFHGVGGGHHLSVERRAFDSFVQCLRNDPRICVTTFLQGARQLWPAQHADGQ
jgi:peptidoglycan/xylan/chitin deacetylase (PgdA/CDA1 family)